ncbi:MAG: flavin reductase family protein [Saccharofermentanales bacterium]
MINKNNINIKKTELGPSAMLNPVPVIMLSCRGTGKENSRGNIITLAWTGTVNSEPPMISVSVRKSRFSHQLITESGEFVVNLVDRKLLKACDFCGVKSGRETDKFTECKLTPYYCAELKYAPAILESPVSLLCKVKQQIELGSHDMFIAEIVSVKADSELIDSKGKLMMNKAGLAAYSHGEYYALSGPIGFFGFSVARPEVLKRRLRKK